MPRGCTREGCICARSCAITHYSTSPLEQQALRAVCGQGEFGLKAGGSVGNGGGDGYTMQLVDPAAAAAAAGSKDADGGADSHDMRQTLEHVAAVLADAYGPFVYQQVRVCLSRCELGVYFV